jgi:hypothetical protein
LVSATVTSWSALNALRITTRARAVTDEAEELTMSSSFTALFYCHIGRGGSLGAGLAATAPGRGRGSGH